MTLRILSAVLVFALSLGSAQAQVSPEEHAKHHPQTPGGQAASPNQPGGMMPGMDTMMQGMQKMMEGMHGPPPKQLYPSLIELPDLAPEKREEVQRAAHERMTSGTTLLAEGLDALMKAAPTTDYRAMQDAVSKLREGLARFDSGLAAHRALSEGSDPKAIAMQWFKGQMNLQGSAAPAEALGLWGLSWEHVVGMTLLIAFAAVMIAMYFFKMRRATKLLEQLVTAPPRAWGGSLRVTRVFSETPVIKTFRLVDPTGGPIPFSFLAGQFLTLAVIKDGVSVKRSYTIASSPTQRDYVELTIKREDQGIVSRHLCDEIREGALLQVAGPQGVFTFTGLESDSIVLIGAGVGATPLMSVVRYLTDRGWDKPIFLLLSFRTPDEFLFREELDYLQRRNANLRVFPTMSRAEGTTWTGARGRLTKDFVAQCVPDLAKRRIHMCGPSGMMDTTRALLLELGVPRDNIKTEAFGPAEKPQERKALVQAAMTEASQAVAAAGPQVNFTISGKSAPLPPDMTVLEAAEHVGVAIDASCRAGTCGICKVRLLKGDVTMAVQDALSPEDKAKGVILACQAKATESVEVEA